MLVAYVLVTEHLLVRRAPIKYDGHEEERVEPEADLLAHLRHPVRGKPLLPVRMVGKVRAGEALRRSGGIALGDPLGVLPAERREGDDPRVQPDVTDLRYTPDLFAARLAANRHVVDPRAVQLLELFEARSGALLELRLRADHVHVTAGAGVDRQRQAEVALARDVPVAQVPEPVLHALPVERGRPLHARVGFEELRTELLDRNEPVVDDAENQRRLAPPAVRVSVHIGPRVLEQPALAQIAEDLVGSLDGRGSVQPAVLGEETPALVDRNQHGQVVHPRELEVLGAGARRDVDDARPFLERDLVPRDDTVDDLVRGRQVVVRAFVLEPNEIGPARALDERVLGEAFDRDPLPRVLLAVFGGGIDRGRDVRGQRPRGGRPDDERLPVAPFQREANEEGWVRLVAVDVRLRELVLRDRRAAAGTPLGRAMTLVEPAAIVERLQEAPDVLDVRVAERVVVV